MRQAFAVLVVAALFQCADYDLMDDPDKIPDPVTLSIAAITDSSVTLRWTKCNDAGFSRYAVYYGTNDIVDVGDKLADSLAFAVDTVKIVTPLDEMTRYYFRVIIYNENGKYAVSNIVDTITPEDLRGKLKLAAPVPGDDGAAVLHWSKALEAVDRYSVYADTLRAVDTTDTMVATVYSDTSATLRGLAAGLTWRFRVYALRDTAIAAISNTVELRLPAPED